MSARVYERVARGEITVEEAVELLGEQDRRAEWARKPAWTPNWLWACVLWLERHQ